MFLRITDEHQVRHSCIITDRLSLNGNRMVTKRKMSAWTGWTTAFVIDQLYNMQFFCISCKSVSQGRAQDISLGQDQKAERRERGWGSQEGQQPPPHQLEGLGSAVSSPAAFGGGASTAKRFSTIFSTQDGLS